MKKIIGILSFILLATLAMAQGDITVCHTPATEKFARFASNKNFNAEHPAPHPYKHISEYGGKMIKLKCKDGKEANAYVILAKKQTNNWVFVFHEWWGLNEYIKKQSDEIYNDLNNVNIIALDMYDGKIANDRKLASTYMQQFKQERGDAIVNGALNYVGKEAKVATVGWCFGGGLSLQAALTVGKQAVACVMYYGMPEENIDRLKKLNCDVLMIWATKDQWINKEVMNKFEANMKAANKTVTIKPYDADHGFANPSNADIYSESAFRDAYKTTLDFLKARVK
jgi:carboxymethylenebutenolidase